MSNYQSDPAATKEAAQVWKEHVKCCNLSGDAYYTAQEQLRPKIAALIRNPSLLSCLSGKWILRLAHMQDVHRVVAPFIFHGELSNAARLHEQPGKGL